MISKSPLINQSEKSSLSAKNKSGQIISLNKSIVCSQVDFNNFLELEIFISVATKLLDVQFLLICGNQDFENLASITSLELPENLFIIHEDNDFSDFAKLIKLFIVMKGDIENENLKNNLVDAKSRTLYFDWEGKKNQVLNDPYKYVVKERPNKEILLSLIQSYLNQNNDDFSKNESSESFNKKSEGQSKTQSLILNGNILWQEGKLDEALSAFQQAIDSDANLYKAHHYSGCIFAKQNKLNAAVIAYNQALKINPNFHWSYHGLGQVLLWQGKVEEAITAAHKAIEIMPKEASFYHLLGKCLGQKGNTNEAIVAYQKAIDFDPTNPHVFVDFASLLFDKNNIEIALEKCEQGLSIHPHNKNLQHLKNSINKNIIIKPEADSILEIAKKLFDFEFYKKQFASKSNIQLLSEDNAFQHFLEQMPNSGSILPAPTSWFFPEIYIDIQSGDSTPDWNPFLHYLANGYLKGLSPLHGIDRVHHKLIMKRIEPWFNDGYYASSNPDLDKNCINLLEHYVLYGWKEKRSPSPSLNMDAYGIKFPQFRDLGVNPLYFHACLHSGDYRKCVEQKVEQYKSKFRKAISITPKLKSSRKPKSNIDFKSLLKQTGYLRTEGISQNLIKAKANHLRINFVIPEFSKGGGGHMTIFRIIRWLEFFGHECTVWVQNPDFLGHPTGWKDDVYRYFQQVKATFLPLNRSFWYASGDIIVATSWDTVETVMAQDNFNDYFYFVQDYEPYFFARGSNSLRAEDTYRQNIACICASSWLKNLMVEKFGRWARHFNLAYESDVYKINENHNPTTSFELDEDNICHLIVYSRKHTARRAVELCLDALDELALRRNDFIVHFFGDKEIISDISYKAFHHGIMDKHELAELYNTGTIGITFSATNYSLVPQEMMACGLPIVEIENESTVSIFPSNVVSMARPNPTAIADSIEALINEPLKRKSQQDAALKWISGLSWETSARQVEQAFLDHLREIGRLEELVETSTIEINEKYPYHAAVVIPTFNGGKILIEVLNKVLQQHAPWPFQTVIVDSSSTDGTQEYLRQKQDLVFHTIPQDEFQHGATRNLGVKLSQAEYVAFLTQDAMPAGKYWLYDLVSCLEAHPSAAGVFGRHIAYEEATEFTKRDLIQHFAGFDQFPVELSLKTDFEKIMQGDKGWQQLLHFYSDNNSCLRRSVWEKYPYPEVSYGEDQLWADIIINAGYSKVYSKAALVYHSHDYDYQETFKRAKTEADFFLACFGYKMVTNRKQMEFDLENINKQDIEYAENKDLSKKEILHQLSLNRAKFEGWSS